MVARTLTTLWYWGSELEPGMIYFPTKWGAKEPQNLQNHRVVKKYLPIISQNRNTKSTVLISGIIEKGLRISLWFHSDSSSGREVTQPMPISIQRKTFLLEHDVKTCEISGWLPYLRSQAANQPPFGRRVRHRHRRCKPRNLAAILSDAAFVVHPRGVLSIEDEEG